jgi:hypothetical protein
MSSDQNIRCDVCGQEFDSFDALKEHIRSETEDKKHKDHQGFDAY